MIENISELLNRLQITDNDFNNKTAKDNATQNFENFPLRVTDSFLQKIQTNNIKDPLLRQILPTSDELKIKPGYLQDPLEEENFSPVPGLLHKYFGRVLILVTDQCAINCRFCFRKETQKKQQKIDWGAVYKYIASKPDISEVILSGGDPLMLSDAKLKEIFKNLAEISHVKRMRFHTRVPIALPTRITKQLISILTSTHLQPVVVVHCNHASEIDSEVAKAVQKFRDTEIIVFSQSVLLKGVNDSVEVLVKLYGALWKIGVIPYYLHLLDKVSGVAHFAVSRSRAHLLYREVQRLLPGYLVPKMVFEKPGAKSKILV